MGMNESKVELLGKVWEGIREFLEVPNESTGSFFRLPPSDFKERKNIPYLFHCVHH